MKILIINDDFPPESRGGAGIITFNFARKLKELGHDVLVASITQNERLIGRSMFENIPVIRWYGNYSGYFKRSYIGLINPPLIRKFKKLLAEYRPDVIHLNNVHKYFSFASIKTASRYARTIVSLHDMMTINLGKVFPEPGKEGVNDKVKYKTGAFYQLKTFGKAFNPLRNFVIRKYLNYANARICLSHAQRALFGENKLKNLEVIHNSINLKNWDSLEDRSNQLKKAYHLENKKVVWFGGRVGYAKGISQAIKAMQIVRKSVPNAILFLVGGRDFIDTIKNKFPDSDDWVISSGWMAEEELKSSYLAADVIITPSVCFDVLIQSNIEAQASSRPVITTVYGGARETIINGETGFVTNPFDEKDFSDKLEIILTNRPLALEMGRKGRIFVENNFNIDDKIQEYIKYYNGQNIKK